MRLDRTLYAVRNASVFFRESLQVGETRLEVFADHAVRVEGQADDFGDIRQRALQGPCDVSMIARRLKGELDRVVRFERSDRKDSER